MLLLPMPRQDSDRLSLTNHLVLSALKAQQGSAFGVRILLEMVLMTGFVDEARSQEILPEVLVEAEETVMKKAIDLADLCLKILSCVAIACAGIWALCTFRLGGSTDWQDKTTSRSKHRCCLTTTTCACWWPTRSQRILATRPSNSTDLLPIPNTLPSVAFPSAHVS
ncbi:hypothetical protein [Burkholderia sp. WP9]|uniref:hypothetical protein n=1 Tax=Burkholderia sp. WP9 TaxID=1500263 RepID=UPI000B89CC8E|nr:hypothetical protein [Burkholderia sp. WP9]